MRRCVLQLLIGSLLAFAGTSRAEDRASLIALRQQLIAAPMVLADYSADLQRSYRYENGILIANPPHAHEFALFDVKKVGLHGSTLSIEGTQQFLIRIKPKNEFSLALAARPVKLMVNIAGTDQDAALSQMRALMFKATVPQAIKEVPTYVSQYIPAVWDTNKKSFDECDPCGQGTSDQYSGSLAFPHQEKLTPPRLTWQVDPEFPNETRQGMLDANALVGLIVGIDGRPHELWLLHPVGYGLDEAAIKAVEQYKFDPAKRNGEAVPVYLNVEVNFRVR